MTQLFSFPFTLICNKEITMRSLVAALAVLAVFAVAGAANAAEPGQVSDTQLSALGLGGMEIVSDVEGSQIRGKFYGFQFNQVNIGVDQVNNVFINKNYGGVRIGGPVTNNITIKKHGRH